jgi:hypothetical protein
LTRSCRAASFGWGMMLDARYVTGGDYTALNIELIRPVAKPAGAMSVKLVARLSKDGNWY